MDKSSEANEFQFSEIKALIIDALIGNDYSLCLREALESDGVNVSYITKDDRSFKKTKVCCKKWIPSKNLDMKKLGKMLKDLICLCIISFSVIVKCNIVFTSIAKCDFIRATYGASL